MLAEMSGGFSCNILNQAIVKKFGFPRTLAPRRATGKHRGGNFRPVLIFVMTYSRLYILNSPNVYGDLHALQF
jgi:hypothetical protein